MTSSSITITMILILMAIIVHMHIVMTNGYRYRRRCRLLFPSIIATCMRMKLDANAARTGTVDGHHLRVAPMIRACVYARTLRHNPIHLIDMHQPRWRFVVACAWWCLCWWSMIQILLLMILECRCCCEDPYLWSQRNDDGDVDYHGGGAIVMVIKGEEAQTGRLVHLAFKSQHAS